MDTTATQSQAFFQKLENAENRPTLLSKKLNFSEAFFQIAAITRERDFDMKPMPDEAQNTKFSREKRSFLICQTTFEIFKFEK